MTMPDLPPPSLRLRIDKDALAHNWRELDRLSGGATAAAAVKANAYGLGVAHAVPVLRDAGCRAFYVAHWSEVPAVLEHVPADRISVLHGPMGPEDAAFARATGVRPVINSMEQARSWLEAGGGSCELMIDTGINRLGVPLADLGDPVLDRLEVAVVMSHLASADEDSPLNAAQQERFLRASAQFPDARRSLANSAGIALGRDFAFDRTRPGLALYGGIPRPELAEVIRQVAYPQAQVIQCRTVEAGETVGYNATYTAPARMGTATVSVGYADGFLRQWAGGGFLLADNGERLPLLGRVSMDMVVVDTENAPGLQEGDWLDLPYRLPDAAAVSGLSQYELLTLIGPRFGVNS